MLTLNTGHSTDSSTLNGLFKNLVFFTFWSKAQKAVNSWSSAQRLTFLGVSILLGVTLRMWAQKSFRNYDFESYLLVSKLLPAGENPYSLGRYNYGPNWMFFLTFTRSIFEDPDAFRLLLAITLTLADIGIAVILFKRGYPLASLLIMISPISVAITGQHQQFDNIAIFLLLTAMYLYRPADNQAWTRNDTYVLILISLSITTKHVFVFFLFWFALKQPTIRKAIIFLVVPVVLFVLSLAPFLLNSPQAVIESVFLYSGYNNAPLLSIVIPNLEEMDSFGRRLQQSVFVVMVLATGLLLRKFPPFTLALVYTVTIVVFTSALADQYLAIAVIGAAVFLNLGFFIWMILGTIYLYGNPETLAVPGVVTLNQANPNLFLMTSDTAYQLLSASLFFGWILMLLTLRSKASGVSQEQMVDYKGKSG
jgi:hypothetical protein